MTENIYPIELLMERQSGVKHANDSILHGINKGYNAFALTVAARQKTYPNICAPLAGILDFYRREKECTFQVHFVEEHGLIPYVKHTKFFDPQIAEAHLDSVELLYPFDKVWKYSTSKGVSALVTAFIASIRETAEVAPGVLSGVEWCINETLDNVLQHANAECGYIMGQIHKENNLLSICVFDTGQGIYQSLRRSKHRPHEPLDAITIALQERVTRDENIGQGNGMWGLTQIIAENRGQISVSSAGALYRRIDDKISTVREGNVHLGRGNGTAMVDFQLNYSTSIDIPSALGGYKPVDLWLENLENREGNYEIKVAAISHGTGTRQAAYKLKNIVLNIVKETRNKVILDFEGVNLISSSYSDELIGKLIAQYGFVFFTNNIAIKNISTTNEPIVNRSIGQRMAQTFYSLIVDENDD